ncbi:hypothetical protein HAHE_10280 [Haloferula helveola]|uniref:HYR domain-containing protein n=1 Tax=Haloferula helveola TaxID=490095 RepID=A0ABM7RA36_9BACT|nr:hypothetical protein HAHE_10280 [Haloferula helveola]
MKRTLPHIHFVLLSLLAAFSAFAQTTYEWSDDANNNSWNNSGNWRNSSGNIPDGTNYGAWFNSARNAGTKAYVTNEGGDQGTARTLHTLRVTGTSSSHNWRIYANQGEVSNGAVSVTLRNVLNTNLTGSSSLELYHTLNIAAGRTVAWTSTGANVILNEPLGGSGILDGDNTAGGGITLKTAGSFSGTINTGKNEVDIDHVNALQNATIRLEDAATARLDYIDGANLRAVTGSGLLGLIAGRTLNVGAGANFVFSGPITGGDGTTLVKNGSGSWTINGGSNTHSGKTIVNAGKIVVGHVNALQGSEVVLNTDNGLDMSVLGGAGNTVTIGGLRGSGDLNIYDGTLKINGTSSANYTGSLTGTDGSLLMQAGNVTLAGSSSFNGDITANGGTLTIAGTLNAGGDLTVNGGTTNLTGDINYAGSTTVNRGTLRVSSATQIPSFLGLVIMDGSGGITIDGVSQSIHDILCPSADASLFLLGGAELILGEDNDDILFPGEVRGFSNSPTLRKRGSGTLTLADPSATFTSLTGELHVENGVMSFGDGTFPSRFNPYEGLVNSSTVVFNLGDGNLTDFFCDSISGTGEVIVRSGTIAYEMLGSGSPTHSYSGGTLLEGGTVFVRSVNEIGTGPIHFDGGALGIDIAGFSSTNAFSNSFVFGGDDVIIDTKAGANLLWRELMTHTGGFEKRGAGTVIFNQSHIYQGSTLVSGGVLQFGNGGTNGLPGPAGVVNNATVQFNYGSFDTTFNRDISGTGGVVVAGSNTLTLTGTNTYSGGTTIQSGNLTVNSSTGSGTVTVESGTTLNGSGSVADLSVDAGGTLAGNLTITGAADVNGLVSPGNSTGTLSFQGDADLRGSTYTVEIDGSSADTLAVTGNLNINNATLDIREIGGGATEPAYTIATYGSLSNTFSSVIGIPSGYTLTYNFAGNQIAIVNSAPPNCVGIAPRDLGPTNADTLVFDVTFDKPVQFFNRLGDLVVTKDPTLSYSFGGITGSGDTYVLSLDNVSGDGTISVSVDLDDGASTVNDGVGNNLASSVTSNQVSVDQTPPAAAITATSGLNPDSSVEFALTFSEPVQNLTVEDLSVSFPGTHSTPVISGVDGIYTVVIPDVVGQGDITLGIDAGNDVEDPAGNSLGASAASDTVAIDPVWKNAAGGLWSDALNWQNGVTPLPAGPARFGQSTLSGSIQVDVNGSRSVGELIFSGDASYELINNQLTLTDGAILSSGSGSHTIVSDLSLPSGGVFDLAAPLTFSGTLSGSGAVTKTGPAPLSLGGTNTLSGGITVQAGDLLIDNTSTGSGSLTVNPGAALRGSGTIPGPAIIDGTLAPGPDIGEIDFQSGVDLTGATYEMDIDGPSNDTLTVAGTMSVNQMTLDIRETGAGATEPVYIVADADTVANSQGSFPVTGLPAGYEVRRGYTLLDGDPKLALVISSPPNCISITPRDTGPTNTGTLVFDVIFDKPVVAFNRQGDIIVTKDPGVSHTFGSITGRGIEFVVTLTNISGDGSISIAASPNDGGQPTRDEVNQTLASSVTSAPVVIDNTPPVISPNGSDPATVGYKAAWSDPGATASDSVDGSVAVVTGGDTVNTSSPGSYTVTYDATDDAGNPAAQVTRTVIVLTAFETWADANGLPPGEDGPDDNPDGDDRTNLEEFAHDGDPLDPTDDGKRRVSIYDHLGTRFLSLTLPVRSGAIFNGSPSVSATIDGIVYSAHGSSDLTTFDADVIVGSATDAAGLPPLSAGWEYVSFWLGDDVTLQPKGFLQMEVVEEQP